MEASNDYSPAQNAIDLLISDHREIAGLFEKFESTDSIPNRLALIEKIVCDLSVHATAEEKHLYPLLADETTMHTKEEHHTIKLLLAEIADMHGEEPNIKAKLQVLGEIVAHHVEEEEGTLFQQLRDTGADLDKLGKLMAEEKTFLLSGIEKIGNKNASEIGGSPARTTPS